MFSLPKPIMRPGANCKYAVSSGSRAFFRSVMNARPTVTRSTPRMQNSARIFHANCALLHAADIGLFNLTPFRGPSADVGTVFELAFLFARGKPVYGYSANTASYRERVQRAAQIEVRQNGRALYPMGYRVEDFGLADNLMILQAIEELGGTFTAIEEMKSETGAPLAALAAFRACVQLMRWDQDRPQLA